MERNVDPTSFNPWAREDSSIASIRNALLLAERTGHVYKVISFLLNAVKPVEKKKLISYIISHLLNIITAVLYVQLNS